MKSTLTHYLVILISIAHIPATLQSFGRSSVSGNALRWANDEASGSHIAEPGGTETLASSLGKLRNGEEQDPDEANVIEDFLLSDQAEAVKFNRLRKALSKMILENRSMLRGSERMDAPLVELRKLLELKLEDRSESKLKECKNMFRQAQLDFHLIIHLRSLMNAVEKAQRDRIAKVVAQDLDSVYKSDHENHYDQVNDRILHGMRTAWASLDREEWSPEWKTKLEQALRVAGQNMSGESERLHFIQLCEDRIF